MTATDGAQPPKQRKSRKKNPPSEQEQPQETASDAASRSVPARDAENEGDGPGLYVCIRPCIGKREYRAGDTAEFETHPGRYYFTRVPGE